MTLNGLGSEEKKLRKASGKAEGICNTPEKADKTLTGNALFCVRFYIAQTDAPEPCAARGTSLTSLLYPNTKKNPSPRCNWCVYAFLQPMQRYHS